MSIRKPLYLTKDLAAKVSGLSARRLLDLAQRGLIEKKYEIDRHTRRKIALFSSEEMSRLKAGLPPSDHAPQNALQKLSSGEATVADVQQSKNGGITQYPRLWLTAKEAADFSGLPEVVLRDLIAAGRLPALDVGVRPGGRYRISLKDLQGLSGERLLPAGQA